MADKSSRRWLLTLVGWFVACILFFPIFWMFITSFKTEVAAVATPPELFFQPTFENYVAVQERADYGIVEQVGSPLELYHHPRNLFVAGFIGSPKMNFLSVTVAAVNDGTTVKLPGEATVTIPLKPGSLSVGDRATLGIRPEHL